MKIKWVELTEDDPIFKKGFIVSTPKINPVRKEKKRTGKKVKNNKRKGGFNPPNLTIHFLDDYLLSREPLRPFSFLPY